MFKNKKSRVLWFFVIIPVVLVAIFAVKGGFETNTEQRVVKTEPFEVSSIVKSSKDFYKVSTKAINSTKKNHTTSKVTDNTANTLRNIMNLKDANMTVLDNKIIAFMTDNNTSRLDKINTLWALLGEVGLDSFKGEYLLDALVILHPIELTDELISTYGKNIKTHRKLKIISMLSENTSILNPEAQDEKELIFIIEKIKSIQTFLKEEVLTDSNSDIVSEGLNSYADISDVEDVQEIIETLMQGENKALVQNEKLLSLQAEMAMSTQKTQEEMLPSMLNTMQHKKASPEEQEAFTDILLESINSGVLTSIDTQELSIYLEKQEPELALSQGFSPEKFSRYYAWAEASSKIKDFGIDLATIALENDNPLKVTAILFYSDEKTIQKIKENPNTQSIYMKLKLALNDSTDQYTKQAIKDAMEVLEENNNSRQEKTYSTL